jgi:hypothetical protein
VKIKLHFFNSPALIDTDTECTNDKYGKGEEKKDERDVRKGRKNASYGGGEKLFPIC